MTAPVLSYASKRPTHAPGACVVLWLWAIVDVVGGILLGLLGIVGVVLSRGHGATFAVFVGMSLLGMGLCGWGFKTAAWAVRIYRHEPRLANWLEGVVRGLLHTSGILLVGYLAAAAFAIDVPWMAVLLPLSVPHLFVVAGLVGTVKILGKVAREQQEHGVAAAQHGADALVG